MADLVLNSPIALRQCILYECVGGTPIFIAYKKLCTRLGSKVISYQEFEFWFMRFSRKEYDLDYDRSNDPKYREFSDLPESLLNQIVDKVKPADRFVLRKVSKPLRQFLAARNPGFQKIEISSDETFCSLQYDNTHIHYSIPRVRDPEEIFFDRIFHPEIPEEPQELRNLVRVQRLGCYDIRMKKEARIEGDPLKIAWHDLAMVVGNEKLRLEMFEFGSTTPEFMDLILRTFMTRNRKIQTDKLKLFIENLKVIEFLQFFDVKEEIVLRFWTNWETLPIDEIIGHPGIKDAKMLRVIMPESVIPPDSILGFPRITVVFGATDFIFRESLLRQVVVVDKLREILLTSKSLELFNIASEYGQYNMNEFSKSLFPDAVEDSQNSKVSYVTVPDTETTLEMKVVDRELHFRKL